ncbi:hypothetical protein C943_01207 [Mariniradius saccharolyticus AK6]|uniref:Uncharacterized protein n=1 Tax=Mariniradius saccharolyticus AK6 TaxID=1239962 RepID=M7X4W0_9BACT|nr:hypothetical protein C943_01207 [Mariniradius saccharolyticus AK6]
MEICFFYYRYHGIDFKLNGNVVWKRAACHKKKINTLTGPFYDPLPSGKRG